VSARYATPQPCPLCGAGPYGQRESLRVHTHSAHALLGDREHSDILSFADLASHGSQPDSRHDFSLLYRAPQWCPRPDCRRGPFRWPGSLWLHAYVWHGYLSVSELTDIMDTALWRAAQSSRSEE
jgi:hypothetical protein